MTRAFALFLLSLVSVAASAVPVARAQETVDLALVLAVDSSGSVSRYEFDLQMRGLAEAFRSPGVISAIQSAAPNGVAVNLMQWSSTDEQGQAFGWQLVRDRPSAERVADLIDRTPRLVEDGATAISAALDYAARLALGVNAERRVIDVSGDGRDNQSGDILEGRIKAVAAGITVNGLAILNEDPYIDGYYLYNVIGGTGAFVLTANDYEAYALAILAKLIKEISGVPIAGRPWPGPDSLAAAPSDQGGSSGPIAWPDGPGG